jgi:hypothetical protein
MSENFLGNLFGNTTVVFRISEKIFVQPCLWLNDHLFHFKYIPQVWTTFSGALHTIRDTVYLTFTLLVCIIWTALDRRRTSYNKLLYWFSQFLIVAVSCILFFYGIIKIFTVQMASPTFASLHSTIGELTPFELLWATFGYGKPYQIFSGLFESGAAILILFKRTRVVGLLIGAVLMMNILMINYTYQVGVFILSLYIFFIIVFLLAPYTHQLLRFFFNKQMASLLLDEYKPPKTRTTKIIRGIAVTSIACCFFATTKSAFDLYMKIDGLTRSRQYSIIKQYVVNNDTMQLMEHDTICWRYWNERISNGKKYVTISTMNPAGNKTYAIERDSINHQLTLHPYNQRDSTALQFSYLVVDASNWQLEGLVNQKNIRVELQRINPDTTMTLLKTRRRIFTLDDYSDDE